MSYEKKVRYLDYCEGGQRVGSGGFAKLEARDGRLWMELSVTGRRQTDSFVRDVTLCGGGKEGSVGRIELAEGRGRFTCQWQNMENIGGSGIGYGELDGIRILLGAGREVSCRWQAAGRKAAGQSIAREWTAGKGTGSAAREEMDAGEAPGKGAERPAREEMGIGLAAGEGAGRPVRQMAEEGAMERGAEKSAGQDVGAWGFGEPRGEMEAEEMPAVFGGEKGSIVPDAAGEATGGYGGAGRGRERTPRGMDYGQADHGRTMDHGRAVDQSRTAERQMNLKEDKWLQLWAIYPHIRPFQDEREYLSIGPSDFVLFPAAAYRAVNNSFLLHGYYNYRHLILARAERKGEPCYYIGVPGSFYEREKQVAIMFGFESFECAEEPAQPGDFGYYMMRTEV